MNELLTKAELAERLKTTRRTVDRLVRDGRLPRPVRLSRKLVRFSAAAVDSHLANLDT